MTDFTLLGQSEFDDWKGLIYLLIVVLLPLLASLGQMIRKRFGSEAKNAGLDETEEADVILLPPDVKPPAPPPPVRPVQHPPVRIPQARRAGPRPTRPTETVPPIVPSRRHREAHRVDRPPVKPLPSSAAPSVDAHVDLDCLRLVSEQGKRTEHIRLGRLDAKELRKAVVLSEILRPPVGMRKEGEEPWNAVC